MMGGSSGEVVNSNGEDMPFCPTCNYYHKRGWCKKFNSNQRNYTA